RAAAGRLDGAVGRGRAVAPIDRGGEVACDGVEIVVLEGGDDVVDLLTRRARHGSAAGLDEGVGDIGGRCRGGGATVLRLLDRDGNVLRALIVIGVGADHVEPAAVVGLDGAGVGGGAVAPVDGRGVVALVGV